jgi:signal transduction histidine kinase
VSEGAESADLTEMEAITSPAPPPNLLRRFLPRGDTLPDAVWRKRHRFLVALLVAHALALPIFGVAMGFSVMRSVLAGALLPGTLALAGLLIPGPRKVCAGLVSLGLLSCSALLVYFSGGYIEAHFHFFIVIVILGLYEDWLPFGLALVFVQLHHGIGGTIDPSWLYNHPAAQEHPWRWAAIHEAAIGMAAVLSIGTWKLNEELRAQKRTASRARVIAAADETRRRIERDLHDGAQQQLVSLALALRAAESMMPNELPEARARVSQVAEGLTNVLEELQEISRGLHPVILSEGGLGPALRTLARRSAVPVELDIRCDRRLSEGVEAAAYYVVSEALTNAAKHAHASVAHVDLEAEDAIVHLSVRDDGVGGAAPGQGSGLVGLKDRVEALGGTIEIASPAGCGTTLVAEIPCLPSPAPSSGSPHRRILRNRRVEPDLSGS